MVDDPSVIRMGCSTVEMISEAIFEGKDVMEDVADN